jgi:glucokinase
MRDDRPMFIAADIGGTNSRFGLFEARAGNITALRTATLPTAGAADAADLVTEFASGTQFEALSLAIAGAVVDGCARGSNLPWELRAAPLAARLQCPVRLLNDLEAIATFIPHAPRAEFESLQVGTPVEGGAIGVIAPGTGIGQALLLGAGAEYRAFPSEAGHIDFAPSDARQDAWLDHLRHQHGHVSLERACSGSSLPAMYAFLRGRDPEAADVAVSSQITAAADPAAVITGAALDGSCAICAATLEMFVDILAAAAGNLALQIVATGGIVLAGGIPPRILPALRSPRFLAAFRAKGRFSHLVERVPVAVLLNDAAGMLGAAYAHMQSRQG